MKKYDEYKDSGVAWIGEVPKHWEVKKMNYHCSTITDFVASGSFADLKRNVQYLGEPDYAMLIRTVDLSSNDKKQPPVYISKSSYEFLSNSNLVGGEIILPNIGAVGNVYIVPKLYKHMSLAPNAIMVRSYGNDKFLYYYFKSKPGVDSLTLIGISTVQDKFNKTELRSLRVLVPPVTEQTAIVTYLDTHCAKIDNLISIQQKRIALLQELKQSVITHAVTKGLNPNVEMKQSGVEWIGDVPKHWEVMPLKFTGTFGNGLTYSPKDVVDNGILVLRSSNIQNSSLSFEDNVYVSKVSRDLLVNKGDIIICSRNGSAALVGKSAFVDKELNATFGAFMMRYIPNIEKKYGFYLFQTAIGQYKGYFSTTTINQLTKTTIDEIKVPLAMAEEQAAIASYLDHKCATIDTSISNAQHQIDLLQEYKQSLITEVVTGKRKVTDN